MIEKEFVIESIFKTECMLLKSIPALRIKANEFYKKENNDYGKLLSKDLIDTLNEIEKNKDFNYFHAFIISLAFSNEYKQIRELVDSRKYSLEVNFKRETYWREERILYEDALFFTYIFMNESYRTELAIDMKQLYEKTHKNNMDYKKLAFVYMNIRNKIKKKSY